MDHDAYMVSPDGHKPTETSPTLTADGLPVGVSTDLREVYASPDGESVPLRMLAAASGVDLEKLVKDFQTAEVDPLGTFVHKRLGGLEVDNSHVTPMMDIDVTRVTAPSVPVEQAKTPDGPPPDIQAIHDRAIERGNGDNHLAEPGAKWKFDEKVTGVFDKMLEASIPNYQEMRRLSFALGKRFIPESNGVIIDIGASKGEALVPFVERYPNHNYYAVECSEPMRAAMRERFTGPNVTICDHDLRYNHSVFGVKSDLILSVLTLMFIPIELRQRLLQAMYDSLKPGGALILVEKMLGDDSYMHDLLVDEYLAMKREHGYTYEQIRNKKQALEGVLVPVTAEWNRDLLKRAGFRHIDVFWRSLMFCGFIAVKE